MRIDGQCVNRCHGAESACFALENDGMIGAETRRERSWSAAYPQYPQSAPYGPGSLAPPPPPDAIRRATGLILAGAALSVVYGVVDGLTAHSSGFYTYTSTQSGTTVHQANFLVSGIVDGVIQCLLWLWMAWKIKSGRNWARVLSSVFFGFMCLGLLRCRFRR